MSEPKLYIRYGVHKDREVLREMKGQIDGLVIPSHIFAYSSKATIAAISYIEKPFFFDPMTYLLADEVIADYVTEDKKTKNRGFKPSIARLVSEYGLLELFEQRDYKQLEPNDFTSDFIEELCRKNLALQLNKINTDKEKVIKKYLDLLSEIGEDFAEQFLDYSQSPEFITPPYFYFDSTKKEWHNINLKLSEKTKELASGFEVVPILCTTTDNLSQDLINDYRNFNKLIVWVNDLVERSNHSNGVSAKNYHLRLANLAKFVQSASSHDKQIINFYGTYYSVILSKLGLHGLCHGIFYGESKNFKAAVGGIPPSRYYIRKVHGFYSINEAIQLIKNYPDLLDKECDKCIEVASRDVDKILLYDKNHDLAQKHFLYARQLELDFVRRNTLNQIIEDLNRAYSEFGPLDSTITNKPIDYLADWSKALTNAIKPTSEN